MPSRSRIFGCMLRTGIWSSTAFQPTLSAWHRWSRPLRGLLQFARTIPWSDDYTRRSDFRSASRCSEVLAREIEGPAARKICPSVLRTCRPDPTMKRQADPSSGRNPLGGQRFGSVASESVLAVIWTRYLMAYRQTLSTRPGLRIPTALLTPAVGERSWSNSRTAKSQDSRGACRCGRLRPVLSAGFPYSIRNAVESANRGLTCPGNEISVTGPSGRGPVLRLRRRARYRPAECTGRPRSTRDSRHPLSPRPDRPGSASSWRYP